MSDKNRLDIVLAERGFVDSREKAKKLIKEGSVLLNGVVQLKPGASVGADDTIELCGNLMPYVSRGGYKLEKAIKEFGLNLENCICMDIGASTGGFTDCMLQNGAQKVYAIDVGSGQLAEKLKKDIRVVNMEQTNFRHLTAEAIPDSIDFASVDVSFISLKHILPNLYSFLKNDGSAMCLIKPQFEAGKNNVGKNGVVKDISVHINVAESIYDYANEKGFSVLNIDYSPIKGAQGNIEYLICIQKNGKENCVKREQIRQIVVSSHGKL